MGAVTKRGEFIKDYLELHLFYTSFSIRYNMYEFVTVHSVVKQIQHTLMLHSSHIYHIVPISSIILLTSGSRRREHKIPNQFKDCSISHTIFHLPHHIPSFGELHNGSSQRKERLLVLAEVTSCGELSELEPTKNSTCVDRE